MPNFDQIKHELREIESTFSVIPAKMQKRIVQGQEQWEIGFDKLMLYQFDSKNPDKYFFEAEIQPNYELHASSIYKVLAHDFPGAMLTVSVKPKFKVLPIPFIDIPIKIPFTDIGWKKAPNKVRGNDSLGTVPIEVTITLTPNNTISSQCLWDSLNKVACLHTKNSSTLNNQIDVISIDTSESPSKNPFHYIMMGITALCKKIFPKKLWDKTPHIKSNSPYPYGYPIASNILNAPLINSGVASHMANTAVIGGPILICAAGFVACLCATAKEGHKSNESSTGFMFGMLHSSAHSSGTEALIGSALATSHCDFASGYGNGLLFNQTLTTGANLISTVASTAADPSCHAPFATRTIIYPKR